MNLDTYTTIASFPSRRIVRIPDRVDKEVGYQRALVAVTYLARALEARFPDRPVEAFGRVADAWRAACAAAARESFDLAVVDLLVPGGGVDLGALER